MSFGFSVKSASGKIVADSRFSNYTMSSKGSINVGTNGAVEPACSVDCIIFYRCSLPLVRLGGKIHLCSMGSWNGNWWYNEGFASGVVEYFVFSRPAHAGVMGMVVRDEEGGITFSSGAPSLKVIGVYSTAMESVQYAGSTLLPRPFSSQTGLSSQSGTPMAFSLGGTRVYWSSTPTDRNDTDVIRRARGMHVNSSGVFSTSPVMTGRTIYSGNAGRFNRSPNASMPLTLLLADVG